MKGLIGWYAEATEEIHRDARLKRAKAREAGTLPGVEALSLHLDADPIDPVDLVNHEAPEPVEETPADPAHRLHALIAAQVDPDDD